MRKGPRSGKAKFIPSVRPPEPARSRPQEASPPRSGPYAMDSVPATVPAVTASPGDPELLGPLSVLYAALIAKLLEVTVPREGPRLWQAGGSAGQSGCPERQPRRGEPAAASGAAVWDARVAGWVFTEHCGGDRRCYVVESFPCGTVGGWGQYSN